MRVPYKEQLRKENEELRAHLLGGSFSLGGSDANKRELEDVHFTCM